MADSNFVVCPTCKAQMEAPAAMAGGTAKCPNCQGAVRAGSEERESYVALLWYAAAIRGAVTVLLYVAGLGSVLLFFLGVRTGHAVEAVTIAGLALVQAVMALLGAYLLEQFALVFVQMARDAQAIRKSLSK
jgi:uncharacterized paraquat-inducible protein A